MIVKKSTCGLCKPHKKWKKSDTKEKQFLRKEIAAEVVTTLKHYEAANFT